MSPRLPMMVAICSSAIMLMMREVVPNLLVRLAEPGHQHAIFGHPIQHAVGADDGSIHGARQNQAAHDHDENMEAQPQQIRPAEIHGQAADQVVEVLGALRIGNDHAGEHRDHAGADHRVPADDIGGDAQILQLGIGDFAIHLRQRFKSAHRQQRVAEGDDDHHHRNLQPEGSREPALRVGREVRCWRRWAPGGRCPAAFQKDA